MKNITFKYEEHLSKYPNCPDVNCQTVNSIQMEHLKGKIIHKHLQKEHFTKIGDLLFFEGALMTLFKDTKNNNQLFLFDWADSDATYNRWLIYQIKPIVQI